MLPFETGSSIYVLVCLKSTTGKVHLATGLSDPLPLTATVEVASLREVLVLVDMLS